MHGSTDTFGRSGAASFCLLTATFSSFSVVGSLTVITRLLFSKICCLASFSSVFSRSFLCDFVLSFSGVGPEASLSIASCLAFHLSLLDCCCSPTSLSLLSSLSGVSLSPSLFVCATRGPSPLIVGTLPKRDDNYFCPGVKDVFQLVSFLPIHFSFFSVC